MYNKQTLHAELERDERRDKFPYSDANGKPPTLPPRQDGTAAKLTVGIGWNLTDKGLPDAAIDLLLDIGIREAEDILDKLFPEWLDLSDNRQRALLNMAFNMGQPRLAEFKQMWAALKIGDFKKASEEMLDSKWAVQVGPRSQRLAAMMKEG